MAIEQPYRSILLIQPQHGTTAELSALKHLAKYTDRPQPMVQLMILSLNLMVWVQYSRGALQWRQAIVI